MLIQSSHSKEDRGLDAYFTPREATLSLLALEAVPNVIWEPAAGNGAIADVLEESGREIICSDIKDYGRGYPVEDYLTTTPRTCDGIVTNPPYKLALPFVQKAVVESRYVAFLLRTNFLESIGRYRFFKFNPPSKIWISSRRLPMMHREGWEGNRSTSNTCYAWFIWDRGRRHYQLGWFDWKDYV